jgi:hypothetical protein
MNWQGSCADHRMLQGFDLLLGSSALAVPWLR